MGSYGAVRRSSQADSNLRPLRDRSGPHGDARGIPGATMPAEVGRRASPHGAAELSIRAERPRRAVGSRSAAGLEPLGNGIDEALRERRHALLHLGGSGLVDLAVRDGLINATVEGLHHCSDDGIG